MRENNSGFKIDESQRQSWLSIAAVWAGGMICVPCLMIGGVLAGGGLSLGQIVLSILIGYGLICVYMICIGMQACDTGLPVSVMASGALGEKGARYIISALLAIASIILPEKISGAATVLKPEHFGCANAIGSAISKVSGTYEKLMNYDELPREQSLEKAKNEAIELAVEAGAVRETVEIIEMEDVPLAYYPGNTNRVKIKAAGDLN